MSSKAKDNKTLLTVVNESTTAPQSHHTHRTFFIITKMSDWYFRVKSGHMTEKLYNISTHRRDDIPDS